MNGDPAIRYRPTTLILAMLVAAFAVAEVPQRTPEQLEAMATDIVLGVVESRVIEESKDEQFLRRGFTFQVRVEETLKGELARGATIPVTAWTSTWIGEGRPPAGATGHRPLPLKGELARFFLVAKTNAEGTTRYGIEPDGLTVVTQNDGTVLAAEFSLIAQSEAGGILQANGAFEAVLCDAFWGGAPCTY